MYGCDTPTMRLHGQLMPMHSDDALARIESGKMSAVMTHTSGPSVTPYRRAMTCSASSVRP
ncbi:hypothetical protein PF006_g18093 [Phytophthora fragariae]|uniref:Uncharacterized protein n=1 Tax=Phytophthora fragariae TaxID=53985 RepID=A0A6A3STD8_9STRA|nr:hypothetical protein PF003_g12215 [Phytophthora fragariae]KAE9120628.1 hypothetical protein PF006_g18093 [Phytophthora fragariae]